MGKRKKNNRSRPQSKRRKRRTAASVESTAAKETSIDVPSADPTELERSPNGGDRDELGRFGLGNRAAVGRRTPVPIGKYLGKLTATLTPERFAEIVDRVVEDAISGNKDARDFLLKLLIPQRLNIEHLYDTNQPPPPEQDPSPSPKSPLAPQAASQVNVEINNESPAKDLPQIPHDPEAFDRFVKEVMEANGLDS